MKTINSINEAYVKRNKQVSKTTKGSNAAWHMYEPTMRSMKVTAK